MCIIVAKDRAGRLPTQDELKNCFNRNSDGAGFMYVKNDKVIIDKGYMTFNDFIKRYNKLLRKFDNFNNKSLVIHFRIGTSGTNSAKNTHPYPITNIQENLHKRYFACKLGVAHNGIIHDYTPNKYLNNTNNDTNDTQEFIKHYLTPLKENFKNFYKNDDMKKAIEYLTNSKFAFINKNDDLELIGDFIEDNNLHFSNSTYKKIEYTYKSDYKFKNYSWDDYFYTHNYNVTKTTKEEEEKEKGSLYLEKLEPSDIFSTKNGDFYDVGNKQLYIDPLTNKLYQYSEFQKKYVFYADDVTIYDKNYMEIY